jgi:hypothetical protein
MVEQQREAHVPGNADGVPSPPMRLSTPTARASTPKEFVPTEAQVTEANGAVYRCSDIHSDIRPMNVLLDSRGFFKKAVWVQNELLRNA